MELFTPRLKDSNPVWVGSLTADRLRVSSKAISDALSNLLFVCTNDAAVRREKLVGYLQFFRVALTSKEVFVRLGAGVLPVREVLEQIEGFPIRLNASPAE